MFLCNHAFSAIQQTSFYVFFLKFSFRSLSAKVRKTKKTGNGELNFNIESSKYFCDLVEMSDKKRLSSLPFELVTGDGKK